MTQSVVPDFCCNFTLGVFSISVPYIQQHHHSHSDAFFSTHLAVVTGHSEQGNGAVGVAAVADRGHVSIPHDRHGGQRLARGVWMLNGVALPGRRGQLGAQRQVLLDLLILGLVEVELGVLQVAVYLQQKQIIRFVIFKIASQGGRAHNVSHTTQTPLAD